MHNISLLSSHTTNQAPLNVEDSMVIKPETYVTVLIDQKSTVYEKLVANLEQSQKQLPVRYSSTKTYYQFQEIVKNNPYHDEIVNRRLLGVSEDL